MNLAAASVKNRTTVYFFAALLFVGGIISFLGLGQLEDPEFTIKNAIIVTAYPGASPEEVEQEITDRIEIAIQEIPELDHLESISSAGLSVIKVTVKPVFWADRLPQIWDALRRKIREVEGALPPGAGRPAVNDDFGDVFGFQLAVMSDGFTYAELETYADSLKTELSLVDGVARVDLWGEQHRVVYVDIAQTQMANLGVTGAEIARALEVQNAVVDAGSVDLEERRLRFAATGAFASPEEIGELTINSGDQRLRLRDIATVRSGYVDPPAQIMRFNGRMAIGLSISNEAGVNIVNVGARLDQRLAALTAELPVGVEVERVHWQSDVVSGAVNGFLLSFAQAVAIVIVIITLFMGWRMGLVIACSLLFTILATFIIMSIMQIDLQRVSLGALVVALGMMVDNAIVVADGYAVRLSKGMDRKKAAVEAAQTPSLPLLGATIIAVMAFYPIYASSEDVGEYTATLFLVIAISLLVSWVVSLTITPLQCIDLIKPSEESGDAAPRESRFLAGYRLLIARAIGARWLTIGVTVGLIAISAAGFTQVRQLFFPESAMPKFMVDLWATQGARIDVTSENIAKAEQFLLADPRVASVASFIGAGPPRFYLPVDPEGANPAYGELVVNVHDAEDIPALIAKLDAWGVDAFPDSLIAMRRYGVGPSNTWKVEARITGPTDTDPQLLRRVAQDVAAIFRDEPLAAYVRTDWRQRVQKVVLEFNQERARWSIVDRDDLADTTKRAYDGQTIGFYREDEDLIPIVLRHQESERRNIAGVGVLRVQTPRSTVAVPVAQIVDGVTTQWEDPLILRRDRLRTITVQSNPVTGVTAPTLQAAVAARVEAMALPPGFSLEWGGDFESSQDANASLVPGLAPAIALIALITIGLFNAFRPPLIIVCVIPTAVIGITVGLLVFDAAFGFIALLGAMSLVGMMIKNAIVLLDQIRIERAAGSPVYQAIVDSAVSRLRPVMLAAATTVLGVIPLLPDIFWVGLAAAIMGGLAIGAIATMIIVPVLYAVFYNVRA